MKFAIKCLYAAGFAMFISPPLLAQEATPSVPRVLLPEEGLVGDDKGTSQTVPDANATTIIETLSGDISVEPLQQIDPEIIGTLSDSMDGFGFTMWEDTPRAQIHNLIANFPPQINSATLRDLARRLLLTTADMKPLPANIKNAPTLTKLRVDQLMNMGLLEDAIALIELADKAGVGEALRPNLIEAHLFLNNYSEVCAQVAMTDDKLEEAYWQKLLIFCQALAGDTSGAEFGTTLLIDLGVTDPNFFVLIEKLIQKSDANITSMPAPTALNLALAQLSETALPANILESKNPSVLRAVAANRTTAIDIRLQAAERTLLSGAIPIKMLQDLYQSIQFSPEELANPISAAVANNTARNRALLYQASVNETIPEGRALIIQKAIQLAKQVELYSLAVKTHLSNILQLQTNIDVWWFAGDAARALYAEGRALPAQAWLSHLYTQASRYPEAQLQLVDFWPLAGISARGLLPDIDDAARRAWFKSQLANAPDKRQAINHITMGYILLDALNQKIPASAWSDLANIAETSYVRLPNPAVGRAMLNAAANGKKGEAISWVIILLGELGTSNAGPETTAKAVIALGMLGLQKEARAIALETAIKNGL